MNTDPISPGTPTPPSAGSFAAVNANPAMAETTDPQLAAEVNPAGTSATTSAPPWNTVDSSAGHVSSATATAPGAPIVTRSGDLADDAPNQSLAAAPDPSAPSGAPSVIGAPGIVDGHPTTVTAPDPSVQSPPSNPNAPGAAATVVGAPAVIAQTEPTGAGLTHVSVADLGSTDEAVQKLHDDVTSGLGDAAAAIVAGIDKALDGAYGDIVKIEPDLIPLAEALIEAKTNPQVGVVAKSLIGIATPIVNAGEQMLNARILAGLHILRADLDGFHL